jgi:hypothetical protein
MDLNNIVGFKAVDKNGNERQVTVDEMTELVSARIVSAASEISTFAAAAAAGTDEFEDQLPQSDTFSWLRTLDGSKNPTLTSSSAAAKVLGGLLQNGNYIRMAEGKGSATLYRIDFTRDLNLVVKIVGEGNSEIVDDYSIVCGHGGGNGLCITHNSGPSSIRMYRDNDYNYYVYVSGWGYAIAYFANRIPIYNAISATKVDIDIRTLEQVGI